MAQRTAGAAGASAAIPLSSFTMPCLAILAHTCIPILPIATRTIITTQMLASWVAFPRL